MRNLITATIFFVLASPSVAFECFEGPDFSTEEIVELSSDIVIGEVVSAELVRNLYTPDNLAFEMNILETMQGNLQGELKLTYQFYEPAGYPGIVVGAYYLLALDNSSGKIDLCNPLINVTMPRDFLRKGGIPEDIDPNIWAPKVVRELWEATEKHQEN